MTRRLVLALVLSGSVVAGTGVSLAATGPVPGQGDQVCVGGFHDRGSPGRDGICVGIPVISGTPR